MNQLLEAMDLKDKILAMVCIPLITLTLVGLIYVDINRRSEFYRIINHPTFVGEVVDKVSIQRNIGGMSLWGYVERRLYIIGKYHNEEGIVQIDRAFIVPQYLYEKFEIGDTIVGSMYEINVHRNSSIY